MPTPTAWLQLALLLATCLWFDFHSGQESQCHGRQIEIDPRLQAIEQQRIETVSRAIGSTVCIYGPQSRGGGSGVLVSADGFCVTNFHVIQSCNEFMKCSLSDGRVYDAVIVGVDPTGDLALIKLLGREDFPFARFADSDAVRAGDACFAVGNPFLLATDLQPSVSWGVVSGTHRYQYPSGTILEYTDCIQTDAAINPGNSGGPLFDIRGNIMGINGRGSFEKRGRVNVGVGYAISANQVGYFLDHLKSGRIVDHATTGFTVQTSPDGRVLVNDILESSSEYQRGVRYGDELVEFAGRKIRSVNQFKNALGIFPNGWRVPIKFKKETGEFVQWTLHLRAVHDPQELIELVTGQPDVQPSRKKEEPDEDEPVPKGNQSFAKPNSPASEPTAGWHEARYGFANYHFNRLAQQAIWKSFLRSDARAFNRPGPRPAWRLEGIDETGNSVEFVLADKKSGFKQPSSAYVLDLAEEMDDQLGPEGTGGLLLAMHLWRQFVIGGPEGFGESVYIGSLPITDLKLDQARVQVITSTWETTRTNWFFSSETGNLVGMEVFPDVDAQPCEIRFGGFKNGGGMALPTRIRTRWKTEQWTLIEVKQIELLDSGNQPDARQIPDQGEPLGSINEMEEFIPGRSTRIDALATVKVNHANEHFVAFTQFPEIADSLSDLIANTQPKIVKITGGGGFKGLEAYQSGFTISNDGLILTTWSYVLDADEIKVQLNDGRSQNANMVGYDPALEIALLKIDAAGLSHFSLETESIPRPGDRILAFSNLYNIATGDEPASVQSGRIAGITNLDARRGNRKSSYQGQVFLLDAITNNPGANGGAIVSRRGQLVGMIGKEWRDASQGTWLNFALPTAALQESVSRIQSGDLSLKEKIPQRRPAESLSPELLGFAMVPDFIRRSPPYIDRVFPKSAAQRASLQPDDLVISVAGQLTPTVRAVQQKLGLIDRDKSVKLTVQRGRAFLTVELAIGDKNAR